MLSPVEAAALDRGQILKRYVRAAAALQGLYDDIRRLAEVTELSFDELTRFVYLGGPPPRLPEASGPAGLREGVRRAEERPDDEAPDTPAPSPGQRPRGGAAGHG